MNQTEVIRCRSTTKSTADNPTASRPQEKKATTQSVLQLMRPTFILGAEIRPRVVLKTLTDQTATDRPFYILI